MFLSVGNAGDTGKIGLLFIDFETPNRIRVQADVERITDDPVLLARWPGATLVTVAKVESVFHNYGRYMHRYQRLESNRYVPDAEGAQPTPSWTTIDIVQDVLTEEDRSRTATSVGTISFEEYIGRILAGTS